MDAITTQHKANDLQTLLAGPLTPPNVPTQYTGEQLFGIDPAELERARFTLMRERFLDLVDRVPALKRLAAENRITDLESIDDVVPLLFPHTAYKSYPLAFVTNGRFKQLNAWLNDYTSYDLSGLDVSGCETLDDWLDVVEANTPVRVITSSGTSGKCSLLPKSLAEVGNYSSAFSAAFTPFGDEHGLTDYCGKTRFHVRPRARHSRHNTSVMNQSLVEGYGGDESNVLTLGGVLLVDVLSMTSQMAKAQAEGTLEQLKRSPAWARVQKATQELEESGRAPKSVEAFARDVVVELKDKTIVLMCGNNFLWQMVEWAERDNLELRFAPDSMICLAGGAKFDSTTQEQRDKIERVIGLPLREVYGFSETTQSAMRCSAGHYHQPPWIVSFVLDRDTGVPLPRTGTQTGRYAVFDLWAQTYWGGFITGDEVTVHWDGDCSCGRKGSYLSDPGRYTEKHGGSDKITCMRTAAAVAEMVEFMRKQD